MCNIIQENNKKIRNKRIIQKQKSSERSELLKTKKINHEEFNNKINKSAT